MVEPCAHLPRLRLPLPAHRRRRRALVPQPRRAARRRRARGDVPDAAPVGSRAAAGRAGRARRHGRPAARRSTRRSAGAGSSRRSCSGRRAGAPARHGRRYDVVHTASFPYFSPARGGRRAALRGATGSSSTGTRCGRARTGATTSAGPAAGSAGASSGLCVRVPQRAFCFSRAARRAAARGGRCAARSRCCAGQFDGRKLTLRSSHASRAGRGLRRPPHPGEARARARAGVALRASGCPSCARRSSATGRERAQVLALIARTGSRTSSSARASSRTSGSTPRCAARSASCCRRAARATGSSSSRRARAGHAGVVVADPDNAATELVEEGVNGFVAAVGVARGPRRRDRARARRPGAALRASTAAWFARQRARGCRWRTRSSGWPPPTGTRDRSSRAIVVTQHGGAAARAPASPRCGRRCRARATPS